MNRTASRSRWMPLAVTAVLCSLVALVMPSAAGAADAATYTVGIEGNCPASIDDSFTYTLTVTNNGADPIEVVALEQSFPVPAGGTESVEFPDAALGNGLQSSIRIDGQPPADFAVVTPACIAPPAGYTIEYTPACPGDTGSASVAVTNDRADAIEVTAGDANFTVASGATVTRDAPSGLVAGDFTINGDPVADGAFTVGTASCADAPSSSNDAPSSSDDAPSSNDNAPASVEDEDGVPTAAPLPVAFTG
jgi:hypothetical protein